MKTLNEADPYGRVPNADEVICPRCTHQFRAIPENVQALLLASGHEPLTNEQIDAIRANCWSHPGLGASFDYDKFARAIERAHGIGK